MGEIEEDFPGRVVRRIEMKPIYVLLRDPWEGMMDKDPFSFFLSFFLFLFSFFLSFFFFSFFFVQVVEE